MATDDTNNSVMLDYDITENLEMSGGSYTVTRRKMVIGDSIEQIFASNVLPKWGTRHPKMSMMRLESSSCSQVGDLGGKCQALWTGTYSSVSSSVNNSNEKDPWELGATGFSRDVFNIEAAINGYYVFKRDKNSIKPIPRAGSLRNSAGSVVEGTEELYGEVYSFTFCLKERNGKEPTANRYPCINSKQIKVAGVTFDAYEALLMPITYRHVLDEDSQGKERSYFELSVQIKTHPRSWLSKMENMGTMARFARAESAGGGLTEPMAIYKYFPWKKNDESDKIKTQPVFGSINHVVAAKHVYASAVNPKSKDATYWNAWKELPYEEMKEPMPLNADGTLNLQAIANPDKATYYTLEYTTLNIGDWSGYNLPKTRES